MNKKAAMQFLVAVVIAGDIFASRNEARSYTSRLLTFVSSTAASETVVPPEKMPVPQVPVAEVVSRKVALSVEFTGHLEATKFVEIRPRFGGTFDTVSVPEGGLVRSGQLLFQIDPRSYQVCSFIVGAAFG